MAVYFYTQNPASLIDDFTKRINGQRNTPWISSMDVISNRGWWKRPYEFVFTSDVNLSSPHLNKMIAGIRWGNNTSMERDEYDYFNNLLVDTFLTKYSTPYNTVSSIEIQMKPVHPQDSITVLT